VKAEFHVVPPVGKALHRGIFSTARVYPAYVRFSNSGSNPHDGREKDVRGAAIKVMGVEGTKLLDDERFTQDFLLVDSPVFMAEDPEDFVWFLQLRARQKKGEIKPEELDAHFPLFFPARSFVRNVLTRTYYSQTAYALGHDLKVKYRLRPHVPDVLPPLTDEEAAAKDAHYLMQELARTVAREQVIFDFEIQLFENDAVTPLDDPRKEWPSPFVKVATLVIPRQDVTESQARKALVEHMSLNPWHSLREHEPVGRMNRMRRDVYVRMVAHRRSVNKVDPPEPTGNEPL
jgi:catalase